MRWYGSFVLGLQKLSYDTYRRIDVLSLGPSSFTAPDDAAKGSPGGMGLLASVNVGLPFQHGAWGTDVYFNAAWQKQTIDSFSEKLVDINPDEDYAGYAYDVGKQHANSLDTSLGVKLQYVATPSYGVVIPFLRAEYHRELDDARHRVNLAFQGLVDPDLAPDPDAARDAFSFNIRSDRPDKAWVAASAGVSAVIRGSSRVDAAGRGSGGVQAYLQYSTAFGLAHYDNSAVSLGLRYEF
jgi:uncharacterized protein YhjY with autotransporter beta-barrel domain